MSAHFIPGHAGALPGGINLKIKKFSLKLNKIFAWTQCIIWNVSFTISMCCGDERNSMKPQKVTHKHETFICEARTPAGRARCKHSGDVRKAKCFSRRREQPNDVIDARCIANESLQQIKLKK